MVFSFFLNCRFIRLVDDNFIYKISCLYIGIVVSLSYIYYI